MVALQSEVTVQTDINMNSFLEVPKGKELTVNRNANFYFNRSENQVLSLWKKILLCSCKTKLLN